MAKKRSGKRASGPRVPNRPARAKKRAARPAHFVGREGSPVLDHYPPKDPSLTVRGPPTPVPSSSGSARAEPPARTPGPSSLPPSRPTTGGPPPDAAAVPAPPTPNLTSLISLERPFDIDEFSQMLGETTIRVEVPREDLAEALRRISDFMGFGIYVYAFQVRPAPEELLKRFVIELQRVDFSPEKQNWTPFEEKGRSESPFGPSGGRR